jgi:hypothetical protein
VAALEALSLASVDASWLPDSDKQRVTAEFLIQFDELRAEFGHPARHPSDGKASDV